MPDKKQLEIPVRATTLSATEHAASARSSRGELITPLNETPVDEPCEALKGRTGGSGSGDPSQEQCE